MLDKVREPFHNVPNAIGVLPPKHDTFARPVVDFPPNQLGLEGVGLAVSSFFLFPVRVSAAFAGAAGLYNCSTAWLRSE